GQSSSSETAEAGVGTDASRKSSDYPSRYDARTRRRYTQLQPDLGETSLCEPCPVLGCCVSLSFLIDREHDERLAHGMRRREPIILQQVGDNDNLAPWPQRLCNVRQSAASGILPEHLDEIAQHRYVVLP